MGFQVGDRVIIRANSSEETKSPLFREIDGARGKISEIYYLEYQPETERYEVTLNDSVGYKGEQLKVIPGLYEDNLEKDDRGELPAIKPRPDNNDLPNVKPRSINERALESFSTFESASEETTWYYGMADCHGIVSFMKEPGDSDEWDDIDSMFDMGMIPDKAGDTPEKKEYNMTLNMMLHTARANIQRHTVVFRAKITTDIAEIIDSLIASSAYDDALKVLKSEPEIIQIARGSGTNSEKMWTAIPNPELDPMY